MTRIAVRALKVAAIVAAVLAWSTLCAWLMHTGGVRV